MIIDSAAGATSPGAIDCAAGATGIGAGVKTYNGAVGGIRENDEFVPVETILEAARDAGLATGLVTTTRITHATPASFAAHVPHRSMEDEIAEQYIEGADVDVLLGGGKAHFDPEARDDGADLLGAAEGKGYQIVETADELADIEESPVLGLFTEEEHLDYHVDRQRTGGSQPGLVEMTEKALDLLSAHEEGFFLMFLKPPNGGQPSEFQKRFKGKGGKIFKMLTAIESICRVLDRSFGQPLHRNMTSPFFNVNLIDKWCKLIKIWGRVQSKCIWEGIQIAARFPSVSKKFGSTNNNHSGVPTTEGSAAEIEIGNSNQPQQPQQQSVRAPNATVPHSSSTSSSDQGLERAMFMIWSRMNSIPAIITNFMSTLGKIILTRRLPSEPYQRQSIIRVADQIGAALSTLLISPYPDANPILLTSYKALALKYVTAIIWDQRPDRSETRSGTQILTLILQAFKANQGFERLTESAHFEIESAQFCG